MSLFESGESSGEISLTSLFSGKRPNGETSSLSLEDVAFCLCRGGWPRALDFEGIDALEQAFDYVEGAIHSDVSRASRRNKNPERVLKILKSLARHQGTQVSNNTIGEDLSQNEGISMSPDTLSSYLEALQNIFVLENMQSWNPNLRSKTSIRTTQTRYFVDPSIAVAALGIGPQDLMNDLKTFGFLFETLCMRDLRIYSGALQGQVYHYRDKTGLECDAVVHLRNGQYGLIEVKLGGEKLTEEGAKNLLRLSQKIDTAKMKSPSFLMVVTATGKFAYTRDDDVFVVPIGCLRN